MAALAIFRTRVFVVFFSLIVLSTIMWRMIWPTVPPGVQFIEEACSGLNYYTHFTCRTLLSTEEAKAITSKGELFLAVMKKTSNMAESYLNHLSNFTGFNLQSVETCLDDFSIIHWHLEEAKMCSTSEDLEEVWKNVRIYEADCRDSTGKSDFSPLMNENYFFVAGYIASSLLKDMKVQSWLHQYFGKGNISEADSVVSQDGTGDVKTIMEAIERAPDNRKTPFIIKLKAGVYNEYVLIPSEKSNVRLVGEGRSSTIITGNRYHTLQISTFKSATMIVKGEGFTAKELTVQNTAGPANHQAVAVSIRAENVAFYRCKFSGYQDTIYYHSGKQFYRECIIEGTIDFIFGFGNALFQKCLILVKKPMANQVNIISADGRKTLRTITGLSIQSCTMGATADISWLKTSMHSTFLGPPWREYSTTAFIHCYLGRIINPEGWLEWDNKGIFGSTEYVEYGNSGVGAAVQGRISWEGYRNNILSKDVKIYSARNFINGEDWLPHTGFPYDLDVDS